MDLGTIIGVTLGVVMVVMGIVLGGVGLGPYLSIDSVLITILGSFGAMMVAQPMSRMLGIMGYMKHVFNTTSWNEEELISQLVGFSDRARKEGLLALKIKIKK